MPYKDPEKKKQWEKENRQGGKSRKIWWGVLYEESAPENFLTLMKESGYEGLAMKHDRDATATGEHKKDHWHVVIRFSHARLRKEAEEVLAGFGVAKQTIQPRDSWTAVARYLCHMDDADKAQYDPADVVEFGGADYLSAVKRTADKYRIVAEMQDWVMEPMAAGERPRTFAELNDYARAENLEWFMALCDTCATIMREYCKGKRYDYLDRIK